eukprot:685320-Prymnesium_polylepis.1
MSEEDFDESAQAAYKSELAAVAGVSPSDISLAVAGGSITVTATIATSSTATAQAAAAGVSNAISDAASNGQFLGVTVVSLPVQPT